MKKNIVIFGGNSLFSKIFIDQFQKNKIYKNKYNLHLIFKNKKKNKLFKNKNFFFYDNSFLKNKNFIKNKHFFFYFALDKNEKKDLFLQEKILKYLVCYNFKGKILFTSTGGVYSQKQLLTYKNTYQEKLKLKKKKTFSKKNIYCNFKILSEKLFNKYSKFELDITVARVFSILGRNLPINKHYVIGNFINSIIQKKKFIKKNKSTVIRSYLSEIDLVNILISILENKKNKKFDIINVGSDEEINIDILSKYYDNKNLFLHFSKLKKKNINKLDYYIPSIKKLKKYGIKIKKTFFQNLNDTIKFHEKKSN